MSFGEFMFSIGFIQKTTKGGSIHQRKLRNFAAKPTWEDSRRLSTEAEPKTLTCGAAHPHMQASRPLGSTSQPLIAKSVLHRLLGCIYAVL